MGSDGSRVLGDWFTLQRGTTYKSRLLDAPGPVLLGLATIQRNGGFRTDSLRTYGGESPAKLLVQPGELYLSLKDVTQSADLLGAVARLPVGHAPGRLTQDTVKLEPRSRDVPLDYLYWLLRTPQYRSYCRAHATGTTNLGLARDDFLAFPAPEPTASQRRIVETLGALEDKIELNRRLSQTLESIARALFKSWFVDFDPVRAKSEGRDPGLPPRLAAFFPNAFEDSPLGAIPTGWRASTVGEEFRLAMGQSPPGDTYNLDGAGVPFYQGRADFGRRFPYRRVYCTEPTRRALAADTLVCVRAPVGDTNQASEDCAIGRGLAAVRHKSGASSYTYLAMRSLRDSFAAFEADGTVFGAIAQDSFRGLQVPAPSASIVSAFEELAASLDRKVACLQAQESTLVELRDSLSPALISGREWFVSRGTTNGGMQL